MVKILKIVPAVSLIATLVFSILYKNNSLKILLSLAITCGTVTYHFLMRFLVAFMYNSVMHNKADYRKCWYQVGKYEKTLYEKLKVKKWKNMMPTYDPDIFDPEQHTWDEIAQASCQAELVHETIVVLSFVPVIAGVWFGGYPVFIITSILAALFDMLFVMIQRYNRQRIMKLVNRKLVRRRK